VYQNPGDRAPSWVVRPGRQGNRGSGSADAIAAGSEAELAGAVAYADGLQARELGGGVVAAFRRGLAAVRELSRSVELSSAAHSEAMLDGTKAWAMLAGMALTSGVRAQLSC
jgi:hypothetical protein